MQNTTFGILFRCIYAFILIFNFCVIALTMLFRPTHLGISKKHTIAKYVQQITQQEYFEAF